MAASLPGPAWLHAAYASRCLPTFTFVSQSAKIRHSGTICPFSHVGTAEQVRPRPQLWLDGVFAGWSLVGGGAGGPLDPCPSCLAEEPTEANGLYDAMLYDRGGACTREDGVAVSRSASVRFECGAGGSGSPAVVLEASYPMSRCALAAVVHVPELCGRPRSELMRTVGAPASLPGVPAGSSGGGGASSSGSGSGTLVDALALNATAEAAAAAHGHAGQGAAPPLPDSVAARVVSALRLSSSGAAAFGAALPLLAAALLLLGALLVYRRLRAARPQLRAAEQALAGEALHVLRKGAAAVGLRRAVDGWAGAPPGAGGRGRLVRASAPRRGDAGETAAGAAEEEEEEAAAAGAEGEEWAALVRAKSTHALAASLSFASRAHAAQQRPQPPGGKLPPPVAAGAPPPSRVPAGATAAAVANPLRGLVLASAAAPASPPLARGRAEAAGAASAGRAGEAAGGETSRASRRRAAAPAAAAADGAIEGVQRGRPADGSIDVLNPAGAIAYSAAQQPRAERRAAAAGAGTIDYQDARFEGRHSSGAGRLPPLLAAARAAHGGSGGSALCVARSSEQRATPPLPPSSAAAAAPLRPAVPAALMAAGVASVRANPLAAFGNLPPSSRRGGGRGGTVRRGGGGAPRSAAAGTGSSSSSSSAQPEVMSNPLRRAARS